ncbi:M23 family metallopeptidase [Streptomyces sp. C11-1]|uniref:M23 family metallopeptidase n=1 Tax=Streptomyces durocortorensis TaxID=2811104 RepID=A0ABY9W6S8_9ACTN|nr:M23 family metallopeptidase [Streptomyces durocortorensis]WNF29041.1 M23 family metallopeptidase [Streptomyces durocortorensis]
MNDQHPHAGPVGYDSQSTGSFATDPLFGSLPGAHESGQAAGYDSAHQATATATTGYDGTYGGESYGGYSGAYDSTAWDTGAQQTATAAAAATYDGYTDHSQVHQQWDTTGQQWDATGAWQQTVDQDATGQWTATETGAFPTTAFSSAPYGTDAYDTGAYPVGTAYGTDGGYRADGGYGTDAYDTGAHDTTAFATGTYTADGYETGAYGTSAYGTGTYDTGAYDATAWNSGATPEESAYGPEQTSYPLYEQQTHEGGVEAGTDTAPSSTAELATEAAPATDDAPEPDAEDYANHAPAPHPVNRAVVRPPAARNRARRRSPAKRSALLTVAVPSACVMSVAGIAAASVSGMSGGEEKPEEATASMAIADPSTVKTVAANNKLDNQLEQLSEGSADFRERASRTQERIDLRERQAAEKKKREEEAARREALRPKFVLPVKQHGLSAYYGQAGINWMSVHTGIDFPVSYGTPVMAATDGTVRTQLNSAYGVMAIVTAADGTETWYCHLSSTKIRSGPVKAGDVIAYSGNSGNSTGPHLHFEVRPGGGAAVDPLAWLRSKGVDPT